MLGKPLSVEEAVLPTPIGWCVSARPDGSETSTGGRWGLFTEARSSLAVFDKQKSARCVASVHRAQIGSFWDVCVVREDRVDCKLVEWALT